METMKEIRLRRIISKIEEVIYAEYDKVSNARDLFEKEEMPANKARRIYRASLERVSWYQGLWNRLKSKYHLSDDLISVDITSFEYFINYFQSYR